MKVLAFTGAGISKQSNIQTFMERPDIRNKLYRSYAISHPNEYNLVIKELKDSVRKALPNDAHYALAEYNVDVITMNIDGLHTLAGSKPLELHGSLPADKDLDIAYKLSNQPVLYGDLAPNYEKAYKKVLELTNNDVLLVIGCSYSTAIACDLRNIAKRLGVKVIEINEDAKTNVRKVLKELMGEKNE